MAESEKADDDVSVGESEAAQILNLFSGSFASGFDVAAASIAINRRQTHWLDARGVDNEAIRSTLRKRSAEASAHADRLFATLARASAAPVPEKGAIVLNGRITDEGVEREGLEVVALDRQGRALGQASTNAGGSFNIRLDADSAEVVLMVADAHGRRLAVDEQVIDLKRGGTGFREFDLANLAGRPKREKADLSDRLEMPDLAGMDLESAAASLREKGFRNFEVAIEARENAEGVIVRTEPKSGNLVDPERAVVLSVGKDPAKTFSRDLVASVVKVETGDAVPDAAVDRMFDELAANRATGFDRLNSAAKRDDKSFAHLTKLPAKQAATARKSLLKAMVGLGAIRDRNG